MEKRSSETTGVKSYLLIVKLSNIPAQLQEWTNLIPKKVNPESAVFQNIQNTLQTDPHEFSYRNKGLTIVPSKMLNDQSKSTITIELDDPEMCGLIDGKTTLSAILDYLQSLDREAQIKLEAEVSIEILTGVNDQDKLRELVHTRNSSVTYEGAMVDEESTKAIRQVLEVEGLNEIVAYNYEELAEKPVDIHSIISYLPLLNPLKFEASELVFTLTSKNKAVKEYQKFLQATEGQPDLQRQFNSLLLLLPSLLKLRDTIYKQLPEVWNQIAGLNYEKLNTARKLSKSPFFRSYREPLAEEIYSVPDTFVYPLLASFRNNLELNENGRYQWKVEPNQLWSEVKLELVKKLKEFAKSNSFNASRVGKSNLTWSSLSDTMLLKLLQRK
jgi:hypothetical protein